MAELNGTSLLSDANLKAYYRLEANGNDSTANGFNLTTAGTPSFAAAKYGNGMDLGASNSTKKASIANNLGITGGAYSTAGWVKLRTEIVSGSYDLLYQISATNNVTNRIYYEFNGGTRRVAFNRDRLGAGSDTVNYNLSMGTSNWYHLAYTYDGSTIHGYVNGVDVGNIASTGNGTSGGSNGFFIGVNAGGASNWASAIFDDVCVFNRALTAAEVLALFAISQSFTETITTTDTLVKTAGKVLGQVITQTDTLIRTATRTLVETITQSDVFTSVKIQFKALSESLTATDSIVRTSARALLETVTTTDIITRTLSRLYTESITAIDTIRRTVSRVLTESFSLLDIIIEKLNGLRTLYTSKFTLRGTSHNSKFTDRGTSHGTKFP